MWLVRVLDAIIESEYRALLEQQEKQRLKNKTPLPYRKVVTMNDLKPAARYLSPAAMLIAFGLAVYMIAGPGMILTYGLLAILLALAAIWFQNIANS